MCIQQRNGINDVAFCGCDGTTFSDDVNTHGIPHPWVHTLACDPNDSLAPCRSDADCSTGQRCTWPTAGCADTLLGQCVRERSCGSGGWPYSYAYCSCSGATVPGETCQGATERWQYIGACRDQ